MNPGLQLYVLVLYPLSHTGFNSDAGWNPSQFKFYMLFPSVDLPKTSFTYADLKIGIDLGKIAPFEVGCSYT